VPLYWKLSLVKRALWIVASLAIAVACLAYALRQVHLQALLQRLMEAQYGYALPIMALHVLYYALTAVNWALLLRPLGRFSVRRVVPAMMIGFGGNNVFPARLGELARIVVFARQERCSTGAVLASLVLERVLDVLSLLVIYMAALAFTPSLPGAVATGARWLAVIFLPVCVGILLFLVKPEPFMAIWRWLARWLPEHWSARGTRLLEGVLHGLSTLHSPRRVAMLVGIALVKWQLIVAQVWIAVFAFGVVLSFHVAMIALVFSAIAVSLPNTPGYVGTVQAAFVLALTPFGVPPEVAFGSSVLYLVSQWLPTTLAGLYFFVRAGWSVHDLRAAAEATAAEPAPQGE